jgi:hypothetical protein
MDEQSEASPPLWGVKSSRAFTTCAMYDIIRLLLSPAGFEKREEGKELGIMAGTNLALPTHRRTERSCLI